jgi:hypothetical protein
MDSKGAAAALALSITSVAWGQASLRPDPADSRTAEPVRYESAFSGYRPFSDEKIVAWRATNDLVQKLGGWRAFAQDNVPDIPRPSAPVQAPAPKRPEPASQPATKPGSAGHAGHH